MVLTKITHENEKDFLSMLPGSAAKPSDTLIRLGILDDRHAAAGALSAKRYDGFVDVLSLYIVPDHRRQGYGRELMGRLFESAASLRLNAVTGEFLEDKAAKGFAESMGFDLFQGKSQYTFSMGNFLRSPLYKRLLKGKDDHHAPFVSTLPLSGRKILDNHTGHVFYDPSWSTACIENGMYKSCLLADHAYDITGDIRHDSVSIILLHTEEGGSMDVLRHLRALAHKAVQEFGDDKDAIFRMVFDNDKLSGSIFELMGGKTRLHYEGCYVRAVRLLS